MKTDSEGRQLKKQISVSFKKRRGLKNNQMRYLGMSLQILNVIQCTFFFKMSQISFDVKLVFSELLLRIDSCPFLRIAKTLTQ